MPATSVALTVAVTPLCADLALTAAALAIELASADAVDAVSAAASDGPISTPLSVNAPSTNAVVPAFCARGDRGRITAAELGGAGAGDRERNGFAGIGADLELLVIQRAVEQGAAVELGLGRDAVDFRQQLRGFRLHRGAVGVGVAAVGGLHGQFADTLQAVARSSSTRPRPFATSKYRRWNCVSPGSGRVICEAIRSEIAMPAASSLALLMRKPEDRRCSEVVSAACDLVRLFCELSDAMLVLIIEDI